MIDHFPLPLQGRPERRHVYRWVAAEEAYVVDKFDDQRDGHDAAMATRDLDTFWSRQILQYLDRASAYLKGSISAEGDERRHLEMAAQQALAKGLMTIKAAVESSVRVFGPLPHPGESSGSVKPWFDDV